MAVDFRTIQQKIERGVVDPSIFLDEEIYQLELERIWRRCWIFVGHESMLPKPGDYITTYMGEDSVIVVRDKESKIRVLLNRCQHRGVRLCPYDRGNAKNFNCVYHGWVYDTQGALVGVPEYERGYAGVLDRAKSGLREVPKVSSYGGFIFANWDAGAISLDEYLGDLRFYFDNMFGRLSGGGVEMSPIKQRAITHHNWKIAADNASDMYHFATSHAGALPTIQDFIKYMMETGYDDLTYLATVNENRNIGPSHTVIGSKSLADPEAYDLHMAKRFGPEAVEYVKRRYAMLNRLDNRVAPAYLAVVGFFPSLTIIDLGPLSVAVTMELYHPRGPRETETWLYLYVEKDMPEDFKKFSAQQGVRFHSFTGSVVPADHENWERLDAGIGMTSSSTMDLNYTLGRGGSGGSANFRAQKYDELPGSVEFCMTERGARSLYRHWAQMMQEA